jgi:hypothetical protein
MHLYLFLCARTTCFVKHNISWFWALMMRSTVGSTSSEPYSPSCPSESRIVVPPLWFSGQSSWMQIERSGFDSRRYQVFWVVVGLERGPLSLVSTTEELLERKSNGLCLEIREYGRRDPSRWPRGALYPQKLALTWPTSGGRSIGIVRSRTQATEFVVLCVLGCLH